MEKYDVLVIGSGSGMVIAANAVATGLKTALVEFGPMGGTCLNRGCIPSKMLIYPADVIATLRDAEKVGIESTVNKIDFKRIMDNMHELVNEDVARQTRAIQADPNIRWFKETGEFVSDHTLKVGNETIEANKIFIVSGARPGIPPIKGLSATPYITSDTVLDLTTPPTSMIIIGGGYIASEYSHFFASIGTKVTIIQRSPRILPDEEPEISELLRTQLERKMEIYTNHEAIETSDQNGQKTVVAKNLADGSTRTFAAETLFIATGRVSNADILKPEKAGVELDKKGYIKVNEYLETKKKDIWALGDAIGKQMFKHVANFEAQVVWHNATHDHKIEMDYSVAPHAVFTHPQIASVGLKEAEAKQHFKTAIGTALFKDTAQGAAMGKIDGFVKVILEKQTGKILGAHIIGPYASILIQEIVNAMTTGDKTFLPIIRGMHIHPAMSEVIQNAFVNLRDV